MASLRKKENNESEKWYMPGAFPDEIIPDTDAGNSMWYSSCIKFFSR